MESDKSDTVAKETGAEKVRRQVLREFRWNWRHVKELMVEDSIFVLIATFFIFCVAIFYGCFSVYGPGYFLSKEQFVIKKCHLYVSRIAKQNAKAITPLAPNHPFAAGNGWDKALTKYYEPQVAQPILRGLSMGLQTACYDIKKDCKGDSSKGLCPEIYKYISW